MRTRLAEDLWGAKITLPVSEANRASLTVPAAFDSSSEPAVAQERHFSGAARLAEIIQTVLTGLILALIFRAFLVEPFIIPTGSMADCLLGAHATRTCPACGWEFNFAPLRSGTSTGVGFVCPPEVICPNCHLRIATVAEQTVPRAGDRILVHKWPSALPGLLRPQRWDVIVFRDPADPDQHYIKRLAGLPGETVEILDGDVFIDGRIARKPPHVQAGLWSVVFDQAHHPVGSSPAANKRRWVTASAAHPAGWSGLVSRVIRYDGLDDQSRTVVFDPGDDAEYLSDLLAYNRHSSGAFIGDLRLVGELSIQAGEGDLRWELERPPHRCAAALQADGAVRLEVSRIDEPGRSMVSVSARLEHAVRARPLVFEFGHVDYRVYLWIDGREVLSTRAGEYEPALEELRGGAAQRPVRLCMTARNLRFELRRLRIDRDVHYTCRAPQAQRAFPGEPFALRADEYFVLGDNSPDSHDSREWTEVGPHLAADYRPGTVPVDQIVGQAAFVYLPSLLPLDARGRWFVPDLGRVRFVR